MKNTILNFNKLFRIKVLKDIKFENISSRDIQLECFNFVNSLNLLELEDGVSYVIMNPYQVDKFKDLEVKTDSKYELEDISERVLFNRLEEVEKNDDVLIEEVIAKFQRIELTTDIVLDKIGLFGIESLTDIDREILERV